MLHLTGLNHSIIATRDLESARQAFAHLGFRLTPRGVHPNRGTANYCIMFTNSNYIELLGSRATGNGVTEPLLVEKLKSGEGIAALAFDSDSGEQLWHELAAIGVMATRPKIAQRDFDHEGHRKTVRFEILRLPDDATPALPSFICRHLDAATVYRAQFQDHSNTAHIIKALTLRVDQPDVIRSAYEALLGTPQTSDGCLSFATGNCLLRFAAAPWIQQNLWTHGAAGSLPESVMTIGCHNPRRAEQLAIESGFPVHALAGRRFMVDPGRTCGLGLIYEAADG